MTAWPDGVIARYLTAGGATVDITRTNEIEDQHTSTCLGCGHTDKTYDPARYHLLDERAAWAEARARDHAQEHAEKCRAIPRPTP